MADLSVILVPNGPGSVCFWCPGCNNPHAVNVDQPHRTVWGYNGNPEAPTFSPSILVRYNGADAGKNGAPPAVCHSFVADGQIQFLADCTHELAGQTVPIPPYRSSRDARNAVAARDHPE